MNFKLNFKAGQYLASLNHILPKQYTKILSVLQDAAPTIPYSDVKKVIEEDFQKPISELFTYFQETPIAAASVAQVISFF
jgi:predicted unusual protein kinase regulating ubiquinone biosynthesis (AarF/ABC1/UbiB family)